MPETTIPDENIFIFVPNLIGFTRIILALISMYYMTTDALIAILCYGLSAGLDAVDGHAARLLDQSTKFGGMLDQLTDRCGTMCLCVALSIFYPNYAFWFMLSMSVDIAGHWIYLHSCTLQGKSSHKFVSMNENPIMNLYYTNRMVLFSMCLGNEVFYCALYLLHFCEAGGLCYSLVYCIALVSLPIALVKSLITVLHMIVASKNLAIIDVNERKALKAKSK